MVCRPQSTGYHVRGSLHRVTVSETRMGHPRYTEFTTLPEGIEMADAQEQFFEKVRSRWLDAITSVGASDATSKEWRGTAAIGAALDPFLGQNINHAHYPTGGGQDWRFRAQSYLEGCLALGIEERLIDLFIPERMVLQHFPDAVQESFLLIELAALPADPVTSVYRDSQEYGELPGGEVFPRSAWDAGYLDHDEEGREIPLPEDARLVSRWLNGKILVVAKGSIWNGDPGTYDGRHNDLTAAQIRERIEAALSR